MEVELHCVVRLSEAVHGAGNQIEFDGKARECSCGRNNF